MAHFHLPSAAAELAELARAIARRKKERQKVLALAVSKNKVERAQTKEQDGAKAEVVIRLLRVQVWVARNLSSSLFDTQTGQGAQDQSRCALSSSTVDLSQCLRFPSAPLIMIA